MTLSFTLVTQSGVENDSGQLLNDPQADASRRNMLYRGTIYPMLWATIVASETDSSDAQ